MTTMAAVADGLLTGVLERQREEGVSDQDPKRDATEQPDERTDVHLLPRVSGGARVQDFTVLSVITAAQLVWLAALGYGFFWLVA